MQNVQPYVSILVILEIQSDLYSENSSFPLITCFNPCYLGNTIRSKAILVLDFKTIKFQSLLSWKYNQINLKNETPNPSYSSFNPCYLGNTIRSFNPAESPCNIVWFQSLLSWKYNQILLVAAIRHPHGLCFNPCYLGNTIRSKSCLFN